ncbi:MAG: ribosome small subunit-dependent GTPase A [Acidobacteria bacterium]|nr:ribosome small subunit-dependent GTPase A [Acidobacteriota bacterium]MBI3264672.1 ribosome small subunit-dependent GTPase A [Acidobacteriota bacterium]
MAHADTNRKLGKLGWTPFFAEAFAPFAAEGLVPGRIAIEFNYIYRVYTASGEARAEAAGRLKHQAVGRHELPAVGDWVAIRTVEGDRRRATIVAILPRKSRFSRKVAGALTEEQIVAANIDRVFLVTGLDRNFNLRRIERALVLAWESGATPTILLTKADLFPDDVSDRIREVERLAPHVPVHALSPRRREGLDAVRQYLREGQTVALLGSSGVGKSTLINALLGENRLRTGEVRPRDQRGRHTTIHRELIVLPAGGLIIDTPGMRELQLWDVDQAVVRDRFDDIDTLAVDCHFADCRHLDEPRCAVKQAAEDGRLSAERLENYHKLQREAVVLEARTDEFARLDRKRRWKSATKALSARVKDKGRD